MNLPTSAKALDRYEIPDSDTVYLIEIADEIGKAKYRRAMRALGARFWDRGALITSARETIALGAPENAADMLAICDRFEQLTAETPSEEAEEIGRAWNDLSRVLANAGGDFAALVSDNSFWLELSPMIAGRMFLEGTDTLRFKRGGDGLIPEAALQSIPPLERVLVGYRALALFAPSEIEAKNSASPQTSSPSIPATTIAATLPQTDPDGPSLETSTSGTQS